MSIFNFRKRPAGYGGEEKAETYDFFEIAAFFRCDRLWGYCLSKHVLTWDWMICLCLPTVRPHGWASSTFIT